MDILIIEDEKSVRENLADLLELNGYNVQIADNGKTGFDYAIEMQPDLVICDINMPDLNGYEVLQNLKENPETFTIPFIFLTARSESNDLRRGMELGADDYIFKPYANYDVLNSVKTRLEKNAKFNEKQQSKLGEFKENFNFSLPHELRTPLNSIIGFSQILVNSDPIDFDVKELKLIYKCIFDSGKRLHRLIENVLLYNKISMINSKNELKNNYDKICVNEKLIDSITSKVADKFNRSKEIVIKCDEIYINLNYEYFTTIIYELTDNAYKFSLPDSTIIIECYGRNDRIFVSVQNSGIGFSRNKIKLIEAFRQFSRDINEQQGIGIGLAIVKRITDLAGGDLIIESVENEYARLIVNIPVEL